MDRPAGRAAGRPDEVDRQRAGYRLARGSDTAQPLRIGIWAWTRGYPPREILVGSFQAAEPGYEAACGEAETALEAWKAGGDLPRGGRRGSGDAAGEPPRTGREAAGDRRGAER